MCSVHKKQLTVGVCKKKLFCWKVHHVTEWCIERLLSHNLKSTYIYKLMSIKCEKSSRSHQTSTALLMPVTVAISTDGHVPSLLTHPHDKVHLCSRFQRNASTHSSKNSITDRSCLSAAAWWLNSIKMCLNTTSRKLSHYIYNRFLNHMCNTKYE
jgi:hypothetical protein